LRVSEGGKHTASAQHLQAVAFKGCTTSFSTFTTFSRRKPMTAPAVNVLYTAHAHAEGGRNGHTQSSDGIVSVDLSVPKAMGGPGKPGTTTPEDLFAAGYAACFGGAADYVAKSMLKLPVTSIAIDCAVGIGSIQPAGFGLKVDITATVGGLSQADAEKLIHAAHQVCPYSNATRNNVDVSLTIKVT
jgi:lipoyl-dependent peroxiredoxin